MVLLAVGVYGIYYGTAEVARQRRHLAELPRLAAHNVAELQQKFPGPADAGEIGYYHTTFAVHTPSPRAGLALGERDVNPYYLKLRLLGLQGQLYATENVNPTKALTGNFDLAFVLTHLVPLFVIAMIFSVLSSERERGILPLVLALAGLLSAVGFGWASVPLDGRVGLWLAAGGWLLPVLAGGGGAGYKLAAQPSTRWPCWGPG